MNGTLFATIYCLRNFCQLSSSHHSIFRKVLMYFLVFYYMVQTFVQLCMVGISFAFYKEFVEEFLERFELSWEDSHFHCQVVYIALLCQILILSITQNARDAEIYFIFTSIFQGLLMMGAMIMIVFMYIPHINDNLLMLIFGIGLIASYFVPLILNMKHLEFFKLLGGLPMLTFFIPTYVNTFAIYSIANLHDISWGNRPANGGDSKAQEIQESY